MSSLRTYSGSSTLPPDDQSSQRTTSKKSERQEPPREDALLRELCSKIRFGGPMPLSHYMTEALTNPQHGYYTRKEHVLGAKGDFVTSPEISQMFGECLGVWIVNEWGKMVRPDAAVNLVELGPGKGTLMDDVLRTVAKLSPESLAGINVHLVEVSDVLRKTQRATLCGYETKVETSKDPRTGEEVTVSESSKHGPRIHWHSDLRTVPRAFSFYVAHEFFDALPMHQFIREREGEGEGGGKGEWHEVLVDVEPKADKDQGRKETPGRSSRRKTFFF